MVAHDPALEAASTRRYPIERRRHRSEDTLGAAPQSVPARRESDLVHMRLQRWISLADTALGHTRPGAKPRRSS
ncbi:MAG TPA: hypothetical protein VFB00_01655 [Terriglobales bacterium]|nr:hypothetical protein [Terriglobales bacterium]